MNISVRTLSNHYTFNIGSTFFQQRLTVLREWGVHNAFRLHLIYPLIRLPQLIYKVNANEKYSKTKIKKSLFWWIISFFIYPLPFEYLCYGSTVILSISSISVQGPTLYVWRIKTVPVLKELIREVDVVQWLERLTASPVMHASRVRTPLFRYGFLREIALFVPSQCNWAITLMATSSS